MPRWSSDPVIGRPVRMLDPDHEYVPHPGVGRDDPIAVWTRAVAQAMADLSPGSTVVLTSAYRRHPVSGQPERNSHGAKQAYDLDYHPRLGQRWSNGASYFAESDEGQTLRGILERCQQIGFDIVARHPTLSPGVWDENGHRHVTVHEPGLVGPGLVYFAVYDPFHLLPTAEHPLIGRPATHIIRPLVRSQTGP